jgi:hypothetical protein
MHASTSSDFVTKHHLTAAASVASSIGTSSSSTTSASNCTPIKYYAGTKFYTTSPSPKTLPIPVFASSLPKTTSFSTPKFTTSPLSVLSEATRQTISSFPENSEPIALKKSSSCPTDHPTTSRGLSLDPQKSSRKKFESKFKSSSKSSFPSKSASSSAKDPPSNQAKKMAVLEKKPLSNPHQPVSNPSQPPFQLLKRQPQAPSLPITIPGVPDAITRSETADLSILASSLKKILNIPTP